MRFSRDGQDAAGPDDCLTASPNEGKTMRLNAGMLVADERPVL